MVEAIDNRKRSEPDNCRCGGFNDMAGNWLFRLFIQSSLSVVDVAGDVPLEYVLGGISCFSGEREVDTNDDDDEFHRDSTNGDDDDVSHRATRCSSILAVSLLLFVAVFVFLLISLLLLLQVQ